MEEGPPPSEPDEAERRLQRGWALYRLGRAREALVEVTAALRMEPESADAQGLMAFCLLDSGDQKGAHSAARQAVALDPDRAWTHYVLGRVCRLLGAAGEAKRALIEAVRLDPEYADYRLELAWLYHDRRYLEACLAEAGEGLRLDPLNGRCAAVRGLALQGLGRLEEAAEAYREALAMDPEMTIPHAGLGHIALRRAKGREASRALGDALRLDPSYGWAQSGLPAALKLRFPGYRWIHWILQHLQGLGPASRREWGSRATFLLVGVPWILFYLENRAGLLDHPMKGESRALWILLPLIPLLLGWAWAFLLWVIRPLYDLALRFHPLGRWMVVPSRLWSARVVAGGLLLALLLLAAGWFASRPGAVGMGLLLLACLPSVGAMGRDPPPRWWGREGWAVVGALLFGAQGLLGHGLRSDAAFVAGAACCIVALLQAVHASITET